MSDTLTPHYSWTVPSVGTSAYAPKWNQNLEAIDGDLFAVSEVADQAQSDATAAQTDADTALGQDYAISPSTIVPGGSGLLRTASIDLNSGGPVYRISLSGLSGVSDTDLTVTFTNRPATLGRLVYLHVSASGGNLITKIASASKQWALPADGNDVSSTGTQELGVCDSGSQAVYPLYIVAGV